MKKWFSLALIVLLLVAMEGVALAGIVGSKHDLSSQNTDDTYHSSNEGQVCIFCHTPHGASGQGPLWNRGVPTSASYIVYSSGSMNADPDAPTYDGNQGLVSGSSADLCLSCHDGTVALNSIINQSTAGAITMVDSNNFIAEGNTLLGTDLSNDHPVNFVWPSDDPGIQTASDGKVIKGENELPLFGSGEDYRMQCSSCHDVHNTYTDLQPFLRVTSGGSELCLVCHIK